MYFVCVMKEQRGWVWRIVLCSIWWRWLWTWTVHRCSVVLSRTRNGRHVYRSPVSSSVCRWPESFTVLSHTCMCIVYSTVIWCL